MQIKENTVVMFHYDLDEPGDAQIESSREAGPMLYLHGYPGLLDALQEAFAGHVTGDIFEVVLAPERAYGFRRTDSLQRIPRKHLKLPAKQTLKPGQVVSVGTPHGTRDATVVKAGRFTVDIDTNHPLAGKTLRFRVEVLGVREATDEELKHQHAHGEGGHQH